LTLTFDQLGLLSSRLSEETYRVVPWWWFPVYLAFCRLLVVFLNGDVAGSGGHRGAAVDSVRFDKIFQNLLDRVSGTLPAIGMHFLVP